MTVNAVNAGVPHDLEAAIAVFGSVPQVCRTCAFANTGVPHVFEQVEKNPSVCRFALYAFLHGILRPGGSVYSVSYTVS